MRSAQGVDTLEEFDFLTGDGEMARLIRAKDWTNTPLGPVETWPQSLRTTVSLCLGSNFPIDIIWGPDHTQIYNDGYRVLCGEGHPAFLGMNYAVSWASAWPAIGEPFARALAGETSFLENQRMFLQRNGYLEETFFTFSLSPIRDETGGIGGLFHPVTETTASMLGERRTRAVRDLVARLADATSTGEVFSLAAATLAAFPFDLPFVLLYRLIEPAEADAKLAGPEYALAAQTGLAPGTPASPVTLTPATAGLWPVAELVAAQRPVHVTDLAAVLGGLACGPYDEPPDVALTVPVRVPGSELPVALIITGASSRLPLDDVYLGFYDLVVAAMAAALANARTREAERQRADELAALDRAKTVFFSNISHEFRTPLTLMLGPLEDALAEAASLPPAQYQRLDITHRNALRLLKLVNSLLDFSRIEAGRMQACFAPTDLAELTSALASNFRSACERAGLALIVDCPPLDAPVHVDLDMWEKIVLNLLSNAFKFTLAGSITLSLHRAGPAVELLVRDTGVGIAASELPRIFERFYRIEGQHGRTFEGTGIGLAQVEALVKLHGGSISASSAPGQGTTMRISIPFGTAHLPPDRLRDAATSAPANAARDFVAEALRWLPNPQDQTLEPSLDTIAAADLVGLPRVVVADDNADMRAYVTRILTQGGYVVEAVADGNAALAAAQREPYPELILSDVMMPGLDGFGLLRAVRADADMDSILVVLLSARAGEEARVEGLAAGADDYLTKPFSARELRARVDGTVNLARQRRGAAAREQDLRAEIATAHARAALRDSERRLQLALEASRLGSWEIDLVTNTLTVSDICRANFGFGADDAIGTYEELLSRVHPDDLEMRGAMMQHVIDTGAILDHEFRIVWPNGHVAWMQSRGRAFYANDGTPLRMLGVLLDVTTRKQAEARQETLLAEMQEQQRALQRSNADLEEFAYAASHDLSAPLRAISHLADWISEDLATVASPETTENLRLLQGRAERMRRLLDGLLAYSRVGRFEAAAEAVDIADLVADIAGTLGLPRGFSVVREAPMSIIRTQRAPIRTVLENLIGNSLKHHDRAEGRITIALRAIGEWLEFRVSDDGPGIPAAFHERIFTIFETLASRDDVDTSGIGLAIVKKNIECHGGHIRIESAPPSRGSSFIFTWKQTAA